MTRDLGSPLVAGVGWVAWFADSHRQEVPRHEQRPSRCCSERPGPWSRFRHFPARQEFLEGNRESFPSSPPVLFISTRAKEDLSDRGGRRRAQSQRRKERLKPIPVDDAFFYNTKYGSPLAYSRPIEVLGRSGLDDVSGLKILDFGFGTIGHLRLLAAQGRPGRRH